MSAPAPSIPAAVAWHDAECGSYGADLPLWERLTRERGTPVLDLGAGTGRVALHLAARGHEVVALDSAPDLLAALRERASRTGAPVEAIVGDVRVLALGREFPLIVAPMQLAHLLGGASGRARAFVGVRAHLAPGGAFALAVLSEPLPPSGTPDPLPDVREVDGWVHSSLPLAVRVDESSIELDRLRQVVSPAGDLTEEVESIKLDRLSPAGLDRELETAGLHVVDSIAVDATDEHVSSLVLITEAADG
jgi:SAM-dependent methyltransferase